MQGSEGPVRRAGRVNQCFQCREEWGLPFGMGIMGQVMEREWEGTQMVNTELPEKPAEKEVFHF